MKYIIRHRLIHPEVFRSRLLTYISHYDPCIYLDSHSKVFPGQRFGTYDVLAAVGRRKEYKGCGAALLKTIREAVAQNNEWLFGYLAYDVKNNLEDLQSKNFDGLEFPDIYFFQPVIVFIMKGKELELQSDAEPVESLERICAEIEHLFPLNGIYAPNMKLTHRMPFAYYIKGVRDIQHHIGRGGIYEMNFCQEFYGNAVEIKPVAVYHSLSTLSPAPLSGYLAFDHKYLISASPERFLKKSGTTVICQPMKGTIKRGNNDAEDNQLRERLLNDPKERAENIMIVDLMRNDLSKTALKGSVRVEECCGIYTYSFWHQMISTVMSRVAANCNPLDVITAAFPMGSMTGAPKIRVMQLIEELELTRRGLYSGALGYFSPGGDFDFNVVIRSILFNAENKYLSFQTGGAVTALSDPAKEYDECLLKAKGLMKVLNAN